jgi:hypothetical protein
VGRGFESDRLRQEVQRNVEGLRKDHRSEKGYASCGRQDNQRQRTWGCQR